MLSHAIDALREHKFDEMQFWALCVGVVAALMWTVRTWSRVRMFNVGRDVEYELRNRLLDKLHLLGPSFFRKMPTGEIMSRATNDLAQIRLLLGFGTLNVVNSIFAYVGAVALMFAISPRLTMFALIPVPLFVFVTMRFSRAMFTRSVDYQKALGKLSERTQESLSGIRITRAHALEDFDIARFDEVNQAAVKQTMRLVTVRGVMWPVMVLFSSASVLIAVGVGGDMVLHQQLTAGQFFAFVAYLAQLTWPTIALGFILSVIQRGRASYGRIREVLDAVPDVADAANAKPAHVAPTGGELHVTGLSFSHGERAILSDVSFEVASGRSLAVVGPTGSGKSTLAALLPRLLPTPTNTVALDGDDVTGLELRSLRRAVGFAQQEPFLFSSSVARNIGFSLDDPGSPVAMEQIRDAARRAAVLEEIEGMPEGFETVVGERGVQLSGGQKQRVALARALLNQPTVLVLDDPLSAVDAKTEHVILEALDRAGEGRTVVLVTHRVAAAKRCDEIVVLAEGRIVERGTHEELLTRKGFYSQIAARQQAEAELATL